MRQCFELQDEGAAIPLATVCWQDGNTGDCPFAGRQEHQPRCRYRLVTRPVTQIAQQVQGVLIAVRIFKRSRNALFYNKDLVANLVSRGDFGWVADLADLKLCGHANADPRFVGAR